MNEISFGGLYIKPVTIKKCVNNRYVPYQAAMVKAEENDLNVLHEVNRLWNRPLLNIIIAEPQCLNKDKHIYILTKQKDNFKHLNPEDILGMADLKEYKGYNINTLEAIQVHPDIEKLDITLYSRFKNYILRKLHKNNEAKLDYKEVGTNLVKIIQEKHNDKKIDLCPIHTSPRFYRKLGFRENGIFYSCQMTWTPPKKK
ncbi:hypothetical protein J6E39_09445 [bacterium]|nr:hypothetical protein [bacterium]